MSRPDKKKRKERSGNRFAIITVTVVVVVLAVFINIRSGDLKDKQEQLRQKEMTNEQLIQDEQNRTEELEQHRKEVKTKQYIEKIAKEKLGLVNPDEILLIPQE